ncbi:prorelaxin-like [Sorex araneus]|uniref:prorelaxin-like n=1 Tax=Sorex araneus TaxID=42254 RepID=UPI002433770D|nr:prorelaxin-like [Sorex araneus]
MQRPLSFHLLGVWLLLSQLPRGSQGQSWDTVIKACGRELARHQIRICGNSLSTWRDVKARFGRASGTPTEFLPTSIKTDEKNLKALTEFITKLLNRTLSLNHPAITKLQQALLENVNIFFTEFQKTICTSTSEVLNNSELINTGWDKQSRKKRQVSISLSSKCCYSGCTLKEIARFC